MRTSVDDVGYDVEDYVDDVGDGDDVENTSM